MAARYGSLETARLVLEPLRLEDATEVQPLFAQWEIVQYLNASVPWPYPADGVFTFYRDVVFPSIEREEAWYWTLRLRQEPLGIIGVIGLTTVDESQRGFWHGLPWHPQGLMTEAVDAVTEFWFTHLRQSVLRVNKAAANAGSRQLSQRQGMRLVSEHMATYVSGTLPTEVWEITAEEWQQQRRRRFHDKRHVHAMTPAGNEACTER